MLDRVVLFIGVAGPVAALPQVIKIYMLHDATGVSALSWALWAVMDIPWIAYCMAHHERPIVTTYTLWLIVNGIVCIGALLYG